MKTTQLIGSALQVAALTMAASAQTQVDRQILGVGLTPIQGVGGDNFFDIWVECTLAIGPTSVTTDASIEILVFKNGSAAPIRSKIVQVIVNAGSGICGVTGCNGGCGGGYIDGVFNTMLCLTDPPGCNTGNCDCGCRFPSITADLGPEPLVPGDEIMVLLRPAPGAIPEPGGDNDVWTTTFDGIPHFWQRSITAVDTAPAASGNPNRVDVIVKGNASWHGLMMTTDLGAVIELRDASGNPMATLVAPGVVDPAGDPLACGGVGCGGLCGFWNGLQVDCAPFPNIWFLPCLCGGGWIISFPNVDPNDLIGATVVLKPAPGALPPLPPFEEEETRPVPQPCIADLNQDGTVNGADLAIVLGNWGTAGPAGDVNGDLTVNGADLAIVLGSWGPCAPV